MRCGEGEAEKAAIHENGHMITVDYNIKNEDGEETASTFTLNVSRDPAEKAAAEKQEDAEDGVSEEENFTAYARVGDSQIVYQITQTEYENLMAASYDDLRHTEVLSAAFEDITQIDFTLEGQSYITPKNTDEDDETDEKTWLYQEEEFDVTGLRTDIESLTADSFTSEAATGKEEIRFTVYLDNETYPKVEIVLYRYDGSDCLAEVDGKIVSLVARSYVVDLIEAVNAIVLT